MPTKRQGSEKTEASERFGAVDTAAVSGGDGALSVDAWRPPPLSVRVRRGLSVRNVSAIYLFGVLFVVFALWVPQYFLKVGTFRSLISDQAITCLIAVALVPALAAGVFDLAVGSEVGLGGILVAWLMVNHHVAIPLAIALTLVCGAGVGVLNWLLITRFKISSFIATLGVSSVLLALIEWISNSQQIFLPHSFGSLGNGQLFGLVYPVYILLGVAVCVWYVLERTAAGRRVYATGADVEAASLAGVRTSRVILYSAAACGVIAGLGGVLESSQLATGDPTIGPGFLLPALAAVFLGSTQFRGGRVNVWGTVLAAYVLATGIKGLQLAGLPIWIPNLFNGAALLIAVGMAQYQRSVTSRTAAIRRLINRPPRGTQTDRA